MDDEINCKEKGSVATIVSDDDLKRFPYQSVGRLFFKQGNSDYCGTGYVADLNGRKNTVITAAHNLWDHPEGVSENLHFVPAMMDSMDDPGKLYGGYDCDLFDWCPYRNPGKHPEWSDRVGNSKYDLVS